MKTKLILGGLLALAGVANAQWPTLGANIYNSNPGSVGIGTMVPATKLHIATTGATQLFVERTAGQLNGLKLFFTSNPATGVTVGAGSAIFQNQSTVSDMLFMHNPTTAGLIVKSTGNVGVGTVNPNNGKFEVETDIGGAGIRTGGYFTSHANASNDYYGVIGKAISNNGQGYWQVGVQGEAITDPGFCGTQNMGFWGKGEGAYGNIGGLFIAGGTINPGACCNTNIGVWGTIGGYCTQSWAGYFNGDVGATGAFISTSDRKLKNNIRPMENMLEKVMRLKPSTYTYKTDAELKDLHLPAGNQLGLIAQELEEVFPELIKDVTEMTAKNGEQGEIKAPAFKGVQYLPLIPVLISAIQEQQKMIAGQQKLMDDQNQKIAALQQKAGVTTGISNDNLGASGFSMEQNEPNPFSNETAIRYTLPQNVNSAYLAVYDLSGKQITTFPITEKGASSVTISADKLSAGIYIYSIIADGKVMDSKRMIVTGK